MAHVSKAESGEDAPSGRQRGLLIDWRRRYDNLRLAGRLALSFAAVGAMILLLAFAGWGFLQATLLGVDGFSRRAELAAAAAELEIGLRNLEIAVRDHMTEGDVDSFDEATRQRDAMAVHLARLAAAATGDDARAAQAATDGLHAYWGGFERVVGLKADRAQLVEEELPRLNAAARAPLDRLKDVGGVDSAAVTAEASARVAAAFEMGLRYADRRDMMDGQRAQAEFAAARDRLLELNRYRWVAGTVDNMAAAVAAIDALEKALDRLDALVVEQDALRADVLVPNAAVVADRARALRQSGEREAERLRGDLKEQAADFGEIALWVGGGVLLLGGLTVWGFSRGVVRPVRDAARVLTAVAEGKPDEAGGESLPALLGPSAGERRDEAAELARAVTLVRDNARQMADALAQTTAERDRLATEARRLAAENAAKSDFLVNLGQLLHGPLHGAAAQAQALMSDLHMHGLTESANDAEALQWTAERLAGRLEALMDYARIEAGRGELCLQDFDVARLLVETRERMAAQADLHGLTLTAAPAADVGGMHSDFAKVRQALLNLADNACVHSRGSSAILSAERVTRDGRAWIVFTVTDDGVGFPATRAAELFRPFAKGAAKSLEKGAGLGLTLTAHYVAMLGGELEVASAQGRGARFSLLLPAVFMPEDEARPLKARIGEPGGRLGAPLALLEG